MSHYERALQTLRERRCSIGIVTSYTPAADRFSGFDYPLILPHRESHHGKIASFYSRSCVRFALYCVYSKVFSQNLDANLRYKEIVEQQEPILLVAEYER